MIVEGDSATIIAAVSQGRSLLSSFGNIVDDVQCLLSNFSSVKFSHVNVVADALAKQVTSIPLHPYPLPLLHPLTSIRGLGL